VTSRQTGPVAPPQHRWEEAYHALSGSTEDLDASVWERLAVAGYMIGEDDTSGAAWETAHHRHLEAGEHAEAARCAFWLAFGLMMRGHMAQANGWLRRTQTIVEEGGLDCAAAGYLLIPALLGALGGRDPSAARDMAVQARAIGTRLGDPDLRAFGTLGHGQALLALGQVDAGMAELDEVMVSVAAGEVGPMTTGIVYCAVILECMHLLDLSRAAEWTAALSAWCDSQPDLVPYRGQCLVHRAQVQQASGAWPDAAASADAACRRLADPPHPALGLAHYQQGELHRLRGAYDEAAAAYRQANRAGYQPVPGLALLELARGDAGAAATTIGRALQEVTAAYERPALLAAAVEIFRASGDVTVARGAADELAVIARGTRSPVLGAFCDHAVGTVLLAEGDPPAALRHLRAAATTWRDAGMPYEGARTSVTIALCCAALGDRTSASLELDTAREAFTGLGAHPDVARVESLAAGVEGRSSNPLSSREREVLAQVASGKTNREIAAALVISEHTVGRHLENVFAKLGVTSRAAAVAHAMERRLL
jgi:DNA-binding CsgD family transcriptional regulator/tetratricopeptide (TPR) repeat protein